MFGRLQPPGRPGGGSSETFGALQNLIFTRRVVWTTETCHFDKAMSLVDTLVTEDLVKDASMLWILHVTVSAPLQTRHCTTYDALKMFLCLFLVDLSINLTQLTFGKGFAGISRLSV